MQGQERVRRGHGHVRSGRDACLTCVTCQLGAGCVRACRKRDQGASQARGIFEDGGDVARMWAKGTARPHSCTGQACCRDTARKGGQPATKGT